MDSLGSFMTLNLATVLQYVPPLKPYYLEAKEATCPAAMKMKLYKLWIILPCHMQVEVCMGNSAAHVSFNQKQIQPHLYTPVPINGAMTPFLKMSRAREFLSPN